MDKNLGENYFNTEATTAEKILELVFELLPRYETNVDEQVVFRPMLEPLVMSAAQSLFGPGKLGVGYLSKFGQINFPNFRMGAVDSFMHFELRELAVFKIYQSSYSKYDSALDLGANLGLHSMLLSLIGIPKIIAVEPDPLHVLELNKRLSLNQISNVAVYVNAVSDFEGEASFTRVVGNTTSSHLSGLKPTAYGDLEQFKVKVIDINGLMPQEGGVICKIDIEGSEAAVLRSIRPEDWDRLDAIVEVTSNQAAIEIYEFLLKNPSIHGYSQKIQWEKVTGLDSIPFNYKEGSLFLTSNRNWKFPG